MHSAGCSYLALLCIVLVSLLLSFHQILLRSTAVTCSLQQLIFDIFIFFEPAASSFVRSYHFARLFKKFVFWVALKY